MDNEYIMYENLKEILENKKFNYNCNDEDESLNLDFNLNDIEIKDGYIQVKDLTFDINIFLALLFFDKPILTELGIESITQNLN